MNASTSSSLHRDRLRSRLNRRLLGIVVPLWLVGVVAVLATLGCSQNNVVVTHWANIHMMNPSLLPRFAEQFNRAGHKTASGKPIRVEPVLVSSGPMTEELIARASRGERLNSQLRDPILVTPAAEHWLPQVNLSTGRTVVDLAATEKLATTYIGIVTYREMAECLGWPGKEIGIADIVALRTDPRGWASCPTAKLEWGQRPLVSFTDPNSSSTARSVLFTLYAIAAGKSPDKLTQADVTRPEVVEYVKKFQRAVDHYVPDTLILNSKIYLGPRYGHFFFIGEDNLVQLYQGKLAVTVGSEARAQPLSREMVMLYPREGSTAHTHSAGIVQANWVTPERTEAARRWIAYLREEPQQRGFVEQGFRPATDMAYGDPISPRFGLSPSKPAVVLNPEAVEPQTAAIIAQSWDDVKKPGVVTFVVDVSGSMQGKKLEQSKQGLAHALDNINGRNQVGLLTFSNFLGGQVPVAPLSENRAFLASRIESMQASGGTRLYDAIKEGIEMTDAAPGDEDAIRGVVVVTDGQANEGKTTMLDLVEMMSRNEVPIRRFRGFEKEPNGTDEKGQTIAKRDIVGARLALQTRHRILVFFVGIGSDADMEIGRIIAEATGSAFRGATEKDLANVLEQFGKYF